MPKVLLPNGTTLNFPDGTSEDEMRGAIATNFPDLAAPKAPADDSPGVLTRISQAIKDYPILAPGEDEKGVMETYKGPIAPTQAPASMGAFYDKSMAKAMQDEMADPLDPRLVAIKPHDALAKLQVEASRRHGENDATWQRVMDQAQQDQVRQQAEHAEKMRIWTPENLAGNTVKNVRNVAAGALKIGPTALKGVFDIAQMATGGKVGVDGSASMKEGMQAIDDLIADPSLGRQGKEFQTLMADPNAGLKDMYDFLTDNPEILVDNGITTIGSMFLPGAAAKGAVGAVRMAGGAASTAAKVATVATVGTVAAQNASDTFTSDQLKDADLEDKYRAAAFSAGMSVLAGMVFHGGAEGEIARRMAGITTKPGAALGRLAKAVGNEAGQEMGEELGNAGGEWVGSHGEWGGGNNLAKRVGFAGALGGIFGGITHASGAGHQGEQVDDGSAAAEAARQAAMHAWQTNGLSALVAPMRQPGAAPAAPGGRIEPTWDQASAPAAPAPTVADIGAASSVDEAIAAAQAVLAKPIGRPGSTGHATTADIDALEQAAGMTAPAGNNLPLPSIENLPAPIQAPPAMDVTGKESAAPDVWRRAADPRIPTLTDVFSSQDQDGNEWHHFPENTGTLGIPRAEMPQIKAEHRGAMVNFMNARGITHDLVNVAPHTLKPTQAEFSLDKVQKAIDYKGGNRSILISGDGHVLDGHHQWLRDVDQGTPTRAIRLNAPIRQLLDTVKEFPSASVSEGATAPTGHLEEARQKHQRQDDAVAQAAANIAARKGEPRDPSSIEREQESPSSWIVRNKETGEVMLETSDRAKVNALNTAKYEAVPAMQHLQELNDPTTLANQAANGTRVLATDWKASPFAPRVDKMLADLHAAGVHGMADAIENGIEADYRHNQLKEENVAFREGKARQAIADAARAGGQVQTAPFEPIDNAGMGAITNTANALPDAIVAAAVKKWNAIAPELAKLGYKPGEAHSNAPDAAQELERKLKAIINALDGLAPRRYQAVKAHKNFNAGHLQRAEEFASLTLGIKTKRHPGVDTSAPITLGRGVTPADERAKLAKVRADALRARLRSSNPFLAFLADNGVSPADRSDLGIEKGSRGNPPVPGFGPVIRKTGKRLDELALLAKDEGFLTDRDIEADDDTGGTRKLAGMIQRALANKEVIRQPGAMSDPTADEHLTEEARSLGIDVDGKTADQLYDEVTAAHAAADDHRALTGAETVSEQARIDEYADEFTPAQINLVGELDADINLDGTPSDNLTDEDIDAIFGIQTSSKRSDRGEAEGTTTQDASQTDEGAAAAGEANPDLLTSYSRGDVLERQEAEQTAAKGIQGERDRLEAKRRKDQDEKDIRARQDASADNFQLGQDAHDSLAGQNGLFDGPSETESGKNATESGKNVAEPGKMDPKSRKELEFQETLAKQERTAAAQREALEKARAHWKVGMLAKLPPVASVEGEQFAQYSYGANARIESIKGDTVHARIEAPGNKHDGKLVQSKLDALAPAEELSQAQRLEKENRHVFAQPRVHTYQADNARPLLLIACSGAKLAGKHKALDLYQGVLFDVLRKWMPTKNPPHIFIVSAEHGLVNASTQLTSYERPMDSQRQVALMKKGIDVRAFNGMDFSEVYVAGGKQYRELAATYADRLRKAGFLAPDAQIEGAADGSGVGDIRKDLGNYLRQLDANAPAGAADLAKRQDAHYEKRMANEAANQARVEAEGQAAASLRASQIKTPGTSIVWHNLSDWIQGYKQLFDRAPGMKRDVQLKEHIAQLMKHPEIMDQENDPRLLGAAAGALKGHPGEQVEAAVKQLRTRQRMIEDPEQGQQPDLDGQAAALAIEEMEAKPAGDLSEMFHAIVEEEADALGLNDPAPAEDRSSMFRALVEEESKGLEAERAKLERTRATPAANDTPAPVAKPKKPSKQKLAEQRVMDVLGAKIGDTITLTFNGNVGYLTSGKPMLIERISSTGELFLKDANKESRTSEKLSMLEAFAKNPNTALTWEVEPAPVKAKPAKAKKDDAPAGDRTAGQAAVSALANTAKGYAAALGGIGEVLGLLPNNKIGIVPFEESTYQRVAPYFTAAIAHFTEAAKDVKEVMRLIVRDLLKMYGKEGAIKMEPYVLRYIDDYENGKIKLDGAENADIGTSGDTERNPGNGTDAQSNTEPDVLDVSLAAGGKARQRSGRNDDAGPGSADSAGVHGRDAAPGGAKGDRVVSDIDGSDGPGAGAAKPRDTGGSGRSGNKKSESQSGAIGEPATSLGARLSLEEKYQQQVAAERVDITPGDRANIDATLPYLLDGQRDDVHFAETRFSKSDKTPGVLFTNGTGTGKTFTGLGIAKRFQRMGKGNGIIVVPNNQIAADWIESGKALGLDIKAIESKTENGDKGIAITTYANFGDNLVLGDRNWDFVMPDEAHYLMASADGKMTDALQTLRALTRHPDGFARYSRMVNRDIFDELAKLPPAAPRADGNQAARTAHDKLWSQLQAREKTQLVDYSAVANSNLARPKAVFLSATPFAYIKAVDWAEGYLFSYGAGGKIGNSNQGGREHFFVQHFGYRIRYHKLTAPDANVDQGLMARQFNSYLKTEGALSGRLLDVEADYDRKFFMVKSALGLKIDEGLEFIREHDEYKHLYGPLMKQFDYLSRRYLLEAIKARESLPEIQSHLDLKRKVIIVHDYKKGGAFNPFTMQGVNGTLNIWEGDKPKEIDLADLAAKFKAERADLVRLSFPTQSALQILQGAYPGALVHNGDVSGKQLEANKRLFNAENFDNPVIILQADKGREGISLHDTTGTYMRVMVNVGMQGKPTSLIQLEGRSYRTGQVTDAAMRYATTGTMWERWTFAQTIAERADIAEALAMGDLARGLKESIIEAYENAGEHPASADDGKGGKARDRQMAKLLTEWDRAKSFYYGQLKRNSASKSQEGADYFATPEPVGLKMVEWADIRLGESVLEPSAGHGAIARWFPIQSAKTIVEPSTELITRARLAVDGSAKFVQSNFEDLHLVNKFDTIIMNPPFGKGGSLSTPHLAKAYKHLNEGGRIVALLPAGPSADAKLDKFMGGDGAPKDLHLVASLKLPAATFDRAGTSALTQILVLEKLANVDQAPSPLYRDYTWLESTEDLFDTIENLTLPGRAKTDTGEDIAIEEAKPAPVAPTRTKMAAAGATGAARYFAQFEFAHTKTGEQLYGASMLNRTSMDAYKDANAIAKQNGGWYNKFASGDAKRGFLFKSDEARQAFMAAAGKLDEVSAGLDAQTSLAGDTGLNSTLLDHMEEISDYRGMFTADKLLSWVRQQDAPGAPGLANWLEPMRDATLTPASVVKHMENSDNTMFSKFDPQRRQVMAAAAAMAMGPNATAGDLKLGKAAAFDAKVLGQRVAPSIEKLLRDGQEGGTTSLNGMTALRQALKAISLTGPKEVQQLARQVEKLLPTTGTLMLTVDDTRRMNVHGVVQLAPMLHMQLFTAQGRTGLTYETVLHEAMHVAIAARYRSLSVGLARSNDALMGMPAPAAAKAMAQFDSLWNEFRDVTRGEKFANKDVELAISEARGNPDEFFVRTLTDPVLQAYMAGKRYEGKTMWERFKDWVKTSLFGFKESGTAPSWLDAGLAASTDALEAMGGDRADFARMRAITRYQDQAQRSSSRIQEDSPEFKAWFGDSKVVNDRGEPLVVYHGTSKDFKKFSKNKIGSNYGEDSQGFFFASDPANAEHSAMASAGDRGRPHIMPVYLSMQNPHIVTLESAPYGVTREYDANKSAYLAEAKRAGADGIIVTDGKNSIYLVFEPEQIKSATGNNGNFDGSNPDIMRAAASSVPPTWTAPGMTMQDTIIQTLQDKHVDMKRVVAAIREQTGQLDDKWDPYLQEELFHGRSATGFKEFLHDELRPLLTDMQARGVSMQQLEEYLHMRHAEEANDRLASINQGNPDGLAGVDTADARAYLAGLSPAQTQAFTALAARVDSIIKGTQTALVAYGLEKQDTIDTWNATYDHYVPLMREDMDSPLGGTGTGSGFSIRGSSSKSRMGSKRAVVDILANVAMARERAIVRGEKNRLDVALYGLALQAPNPEFWKPVNPQKNPAALMGELANMGLSPALVQAIIDEPKQRVIDKQTGMVTSRVNPMLRSAPNVVAVRINGEDRFVFFNEKNDRAMRMAISLKNLGNDGLNRFLNIMAIGTRWFASVNTQYNPIFGIVNFTRDIGEGSINLESTPIAGHQVEFAGEAGRLFGAAAKHGFRLEKLTGNDAALWKEFQEEGGITGFRAQFSTSTDRAKELHKELTRMQAGHVKQAGRAVLEWLSDYNEALENVTRLAAYKTAKNSGMTNQQAASLAKNLTVNFNRKGAIGSQVNSLFAFFNAATQGIARMGETLAGPTGKKIIVGGILLGVLQAIMMAAAGYDDDNPPEFVKAKNFVIPLGLITGKKDFLTIPYPLGYAFIPTMGRISTEFALGGGKKVGKHLVEMTGALLDTFNPIGNGNIVQVLTPTVFDPVVDLAINKDWTGKPIARQDFNSLHPTPGFSRTKDTASGMAKGLSYFLNSASGGNKYTPGMFSPTPDQIDYLTGQLTGGVGREAIKAQQTAAAIYTGEELPAHKIPLVGRFYNTADDKSAAATKFYDNLKELNGFGDEVKGRAKDHADPKAFIAEHPEARLAEMGEAVHTQVAQLRKHKAELLDKGASKVRIKEIELQQRKLMEKFNEKVEAARKKAPA